MALNQYAQHDQLAIDNNVAERALYRHRRPRLAVLGL
jgi:hypothetical protein